MKDDHKTKKQLIDELTELRSQNAELKKSENSEKYRLLVENIRDIIYELDSQGVVLYISPAVRDVLGYDLAEIEGKNFTELAHKDDLGRLTEWFSELRTGIEKPSEYRVSNKSGELRWARTKARPIMEEGLFKGARGIIIDVTDQRRAEEKLRDSEELFKNYLDYAPDGVYISDLEGNFLYGNRKCEKIIGYKREELIGKNLLELNILPEKSLNKAARLLQANIEGKSTGPDEIELISKEGRIMPVEISTSLIKHTGQVIILAFVRDITDRKRAEETLRKTEEIYRMVVDNMADVITVMDLNLRFTYVSPSVFRLRGYTAEEVMSQTMEQMMTPESLQIVAKVFEEEMKSEASGMADPSRTRVLELEEYRKDGSIVWLENHLSFMRDEAKKPVGIISVSQDITQRRRAEEALNKAKTLLDKTFASMEEAIFIVDSNTRRIIACNQATEVIFGFGEKDLIGCSTDVLHVDKLSYDLFGQKLFPALDANGVFRLEFQMRRKDGSVFSTEHTVTEILDDFGQRTSVVSVVRDITQRKQAEEEIKQREVFLNTLLSSIPIPIFYKDRDGRYTGFNRAYENFFGATKEKLIGKTVFDISPPELAEIFHAKDNDLLESGVEQEYESQVKNTLGVIRDVIFNMAVFTDSKGAVNGLIGTILDITERKQAEERLKDTLKSLRKSFGTIIQVMVSAVETRDPYTAGHQLRVADIARAIATEMGLSQEKIDGIRMAGSIHDIGKLSIPGEILSKPGKLSAIEFSLIKEHPLKGYEILKDVESPWPLAQIVYQHHERMDGSGYPRNLTGDEILLDARIMAVADVVESMASHRPYRHALGINAALEEIENNKETLYDADVADACLKLFREKGFQLVS